jgi:hypothetical protein
LISIVFSFYLHSILIEIWCYCFLLLDQDA